MLDFGKTRANFGFIIIAIIGSASPMLIKKKILNPNGMDLNNAMAKALPKNGAVQGVAIMVVNIPLKIILLLFFDANFGSEI